jgi:hypothetical protein
MDAHNAAVEWGLSHGLLGMVAGACLAAAVYGRAHRLDRREKGAGRRAILLCFCLASMNYVTFRDLLIMAAGPLILSMVSEPSGVASTTPSTCRAGVPSRRWLPRRVRSCGTAWSGRRSRAIS